MKLNTKVLAVSATSVALVGGLAFAAPSLAVTDSATSSATTSQDCERGEGGEHNHAELSATVTGIPSDVTDIRSAVRGAYFTAYKIDSAALPTTQPTEGGRILGVHPEHSDEATAVTPEIVNQSFTGELGFRAGASEGTSYFALYPSDGSAPVLVTVVVDADGVATATSSADLSVAYSADVAAAAPDMGHKGERGHRGEKGMRGGFRGGHGHAPQMEATPNA